MCVHMASQVGSHYFVDNLSEHITELGEVTEKVTDESMIRRSDLKKWLYRDEKKITMDRRVSKWESS